MKVLDDAPVENQKSGEFDRGVKLAGGRGSEVEVRLAAGRKQDWSEVGSAKK